MATRTTKNTTRSRKRSAKKKTKWSINWKKVLFFFILTSILTFSMAAAGYVIFFRTVFAQDNIPAPSKNIVYEEPDPPQHLDAISPADSAKASHELPKVAIIIDDMGYDGKLGQAMIDVPIMMTYSFLPFATNTANLAETAFWEGKDIFLHLPLQPQSLVVDPGPGTIYVSDSSALQLEKFSRNLAAVPHAIGVNNHMGSKFTLYQAGMTTLLQEMATQKLIFIDSVTASDSVAFDTALKLKVKSARRQVFLDNNLDTNKICGQLEKLVNLAETKGAAIGIGHPHEATLAALKGCTAQYSGRIQFVAVHELFELR